LQNIPIVHFKYLSSCSEYTGILPLCLYSQKKTKTKTKKPSKSQGPEIKYLLDLGKTLFITFNRFVSQRV